LSAAQKVLPFEMRNLVVSGAKWTKKSWEFSHLLCVLYAELTVKVRSLFMLYTRSIFLNEGSSGIQIQRIIFFLIKLYNIYYYYDKVDRILWWLANAECWVLASFSLL
jgi:hypothetical protein